MRVGEVMRTDVPTIGPDAPATALVEPLLSGRETVVVVVDEEGRLLGIVTAVDVLASRASEVTRALRRRDDDAVRHEIADLINRTLCFSPGHRVSARVVNGTVTLEGTVQTASEARWLGVLVRGIDGVGAVDNRVSAQDTIFVERTLDRRQP